MAESLKSEEAPRVEMVVANEFPLDNVPLQLHEMLEFSISNPLLIYFPLLIATKLQIR